MQDPYHYVDTASGASEITGPNIYCNEIKVQRKQIADKWPDTATLGTSNATFSSNPF